MKIIQNRRDRSAIFHIIKTVFSTSNTYTVTTKNDNTLAYITLSE